MTGSTGSTGSTNSPGSTNSTGSPDSTNSPDSTDLPRAGWEISVQMQLGSLELRVEMAGRSPVVALVGPNGSGKTSLLRTVAGAYRPTAGHIRIADHTVFASERNLFVPPELRRVGYVPQGYGLFPHLRVVDNVAFGLQGRSTNHSPSRGERRAAAREQLEKLGCGHLATRFPERLSGGEQQRVALARALITQPRMLLLDEPFAALDAAARRSMRKSLAEHFKAGDTPALIVTHHLPDVLALNATVFVIEAGKIVASGTPAALAAAPTTAFVAEFFHAAPTPAPLLEARSGEESAFL
ncbi:MAG: ATP-binding cassette domain-containing protein [Nannocystaceae bacterium]